MGKQPSFHCPAVGQRSNQEFFFSLIFTCFFKSCQRKTNLAFFLNSHSVRFPAVLVLNQLYQIFTNCCSVRRLTYRCASYQVTYVIHFRWHLLFGFRSLRLPIAWRHFRFRREGVSGRVSRLGSTKGVGRFGSDKLTVDINIGLKDENMDKGLNDSHSHFAFGMISFYSERTRRPVHFLFNTFSLTGSGTTHNRTFGFI